MDWLGKGITDHYHLPVIPAPLEGCKHTQPVQVISLSKCRNMSSPPLFLSPHWFVYRHFSPARDGQTLPLSAKRVSAIQPEQRAETQSSHFSLFLCSISSQPSHICCEFVSTHLPELSHFFFFFFFWNILLLSEWMAQGCALIRSLCFCYLAVNIKDRCNANAFKHQLPLLRIPNQMKKTPALARFSPLFCTIPSLTHRSVSRYFNLKINIHNFCYDYPPSSPKIQVLATSCCICAQF